MNGRNVTALAVMSLLSSLAVSAKSYEAERYRVQLELDSQGSLNVTETVVFRFHGGSFTYVDRDISGRETDGIRDIRTWLDDQPAAAIIKGTHVQWRFAPISDETHSYTVRYRADGVIRRSASAETLVWRALPERRKYRIEAAEISLAVPDGMALPALSMRPKRPVETGSGQETVVFETLNAGTDVVMTARFAPGTFRGGTPRWEAARSERRLEFITGIEAATWLGIAALAAIFWWIRRAPLDPMSPVAIMNPPAPGTLPPALAGRLMGGSHAALAVLADLARRGIVRVEQEKRSLLGSKFRVVLEQRGVSLAPHERVLLSATLRTADTVTLPAFQQRAAMAASSFGKAITAALVEVGLYDRERLRIRTRLLRYGFAMSFIGFAAGVATLLLYRNGPAMTAGWLTVAAAVLAGSGIAAVVGGVRTGPLTEAGVSETTRWREYRAQLRNGPLPQAGEWDKILPYAIALGTAPSLVKRARKSGGFQPPDWFRSPEADSDGDGFVSFVTAGDAGSYGGGGDGGGGGASGGGGSGAG